MPHPGEAVDAEFLDPHFHAAEKIVCYSRVAQVQFYKLVVSFPAFIPEPVIVVWITVKADMKPVFVWGIPSFLQNILKCPEPSSNVVEYTI